MAMKNKIPVRLKKEPLLEAVWEIRFSGTKPSVADLMPGMLFRTLSCKYRNIVRLPIADIPATIVEHDPNLRYAPKIRLENDNQVVQIGEHVISLNCRRPYSGWTQFSADIRELAKVVQDTGLIERLERFSLRYIDLIELAQPIGLDCLNLTLKLGEYEINTRPVELRTKIEEGDLIHIVQITSPAEVVIPKEEGRLKGVLLDIDTIRLLAEKGSWYDISEHLDDVHMACKKMFFSLLKPETIGKLEPEYEV
jgi:uncharacterized protein (TIGR04255 family)